MPSNLRHKQGLHVAIIMDGNGRWALRRGLPRSAGHRAGARALRAIIETAPELAISTLTVFAFSSDNWKRPPDELSALMRLLRGYLRREATRFVESGARLKVIGRIDRLPAPLQMLIGRVEQGSRDGDRLTIRIAIDYSARDSIVRAARMLAVNGTFTREDMARAIGSPASADCPLAPADAEVDLLIRTGGEKRLSDFMLWEAAYAELIFSDLMWPDFAPEHLRAALAEFHRRERRFGAIGASAEQAHFGKGAANDEPRDPH